MEAWRGSQQYIGRHLRELRDGFEKHGKSRMEIRVAPRGGLRRASRVTQRGLVRNFGWFVMELGKLRVAPRETQGETQGEHRELMQGLGELPRGELVGALRGLLKAQRGCFSVCQGLCWITQGDTWKSGCCLRHSVIFHHTVTLFTEIDALQF